MFITATSLPLLVALAEIGLRNGTMLPENAAALVGAGRRRGVVGDLLPGDRRRNRDPQNGQRAYHANFRGPIRRAAPDQDVPGACLQYVAGSLSPRAAGDSTSACPDPRHPRRREDWPEVTPQLVPQLAGTPVPLDKSLPPPVPLLGVAIALDAKYTGHQPGY